MNQDNVRFLPAPDADPTEGTPISLLSGHSCRVYAVGPDGKPGTWIPPRFRKQAVAAGCGIVGIDEHVEPEPDDQAKQTLIVAAIEKLIDANEPDTLNNNGRPKIEALRDTAGVGITKEEADAAWAQFVAGLGD